MGRHRAASPSSRLAKGAAIAAFFGAGLTLAPTAVAAPAPPPPGPPPGYDGLPYHNMPGRIGHQPGAYTYILGFYLRPRRVLDTAGIGAMSNTDLRSSEFGLPGDELGVEPIRRSWTGNVPGVRADVPMDAPGAADPAGGVRPATSMPVGFTGGGLEDPTGGTARALPLGGESSQPKLGGNVEPDSQNDGPDPDPGVTK
jgi:hypothetical protein